MLTRFREAISGAISERDRKLYIFTEWVAAGSIQHMIEQFGPLGLAVVSQYSRQMLHEKAIIHDLLYHNICIYKYYL